MTPIKSPDRVIFDQGNSSNSCLVKSNIETEDSISHSTYYQYCDAIASNKSASLFATPYMHRSSGSKTTTYISILNQKRRQNRHVVQCPAARFYGHALFLSEGCCCTMPGKIVKPCALNFDSDVAVHVRLSFKPKLIFALFAFKFRWKSTYRNARCVGVFQCLNMPTGISMLSQGFHGINYQLVNGINVTSVKPPNRVVFNQRNPFNRRSIRCHEETINSVAHRINYENCDAIARF